MRRQLVPAVIAIVLFTAITLVYGVGTTLVDQVLFKHKAEGSLVKDAKGHVVGSSLIGQDFTSPEVLPSPPGGRRLLLGPGLQLRLQLRPDERGPHRQRPRRVASTTRRTRTRRRATRTACRCSPPTRTATPITDKAGNPVYDKNKDGTYVCNPNTVPERVLAYRQLNGLGPDVQVPVDAVTASASGLDPDITVANAKLQAPRVAAARHLRSTPFSRSVKANTDERAFGVLGEPAVNVLELNLALDRQTGARDVLVVVDRRVRQEADAHARLGEEVARVRGVGLELVPELRHELAEVVGLVHVARAPHLLEQLPLAHEPVGIAHEDLDEMPLRRRQLDLGAVARPSRASS